MTHSFDKDYWDAHWQQVGGPAPAPNPHLARELADLPPGTALDAGCGEGAEAIWLATQGWHVTAADISAGALERARRRAAAEATDVRWVEADLCVWEPDAPFDLVTTHYAHPALSQLDFYERVAGWVKPGGTVLIVGHLHTSTSGHEHGHEHGPSQDRPPESATVTAAGVAARLDAARWDIVTADEPTRVADRGGRTVQLDDVVVRATRYG